MSDAIPVTVVGKMLEVYDFLRKTFPKHDPKNRDLPVHTEHQVGNATIKTTIYQDHYSVCFDIQVVTPVGSQDNFALDFAEAVRGAFPNERVIVNNNYNVTGRWGEKQIEPELEFEINATKALLTTTGVQVEFLMLAMFKLESIDLVAHFLKGFAFPEDAFPPIFQPAKDDRTIVMPPYSAGRAYVLNNDRLRDRFGNLETLDKLIQLGRYIKIHTNSMAFAELINEHISSNALVNGDRQVVLETFKAE